MIAKLSELHKYAPRSYDNLWHFQRENWTEVTHTGQSFGGKAFTLEEYLDVEDSFLECFEYVLSQCSIAEPQTLRDTSTIEEAPTLNEVVFGLSDVDLANYEDRSILNRADIRRFLRQTLRGLAGFAVTNQKDFFI